MGKLQGLHEYLEPDDPADQDAHELYSATEQVCDWRRIALAHKASQTMTDGANGAWWTSIPIVGITLRGQCGPPGEQ